LTTLDEETKRMHQLHTHLWQGIRHLPNIQLNGSSIYRVPHNLNVTFKGLDGQTILLALHELAVSTTSACLAKTHQPSHVLEAIGLSRQDALSSVRLSLGRYTTCEEIELTIAIVCKQMSRLYDMVP
jgi:cysteine desulfurase